MLSSKTLMFIWFSLYFVFFIADYIVQGHTCMKGPSWQDLEHSKDQKAKVSDRIVIHNYSYHAHDTVNVACTYRIIRIGRHILVGVFRPNRCHLNTIKCLLVQFGVRFETVVSF